MRAESPKHGGEGYPDAAEVSGLETGEDPARKVKAACGYSLRSDGAGKPRASELEALEGTE